MRAVIVTAENGSFSLRLSESHGESVNFGQICVFDLGSKRPVIFTVHLYSAITRCSANQSGRYEETVL